jgi:hypothetical protein
MPEDTVWYAPFDLAIGMMTIHSHENMVKSTIDVLPANPPRVASSDPACGGMAGGVPAAHAYEGYDYFEPKVCEYWRQPDGPLILRKGQAIRTSCIIDTESIRPTRSTIPRCAPRSRTVPSVTRSTGTRILRCTGSVTRASGSWAYRRESRSIWSGSESRNIPKTARRIPRPTTAAAPSTVHTPHRATARPTAATPGAAYRRAWFSRTRGRMRCASRSSCTGRSIAC